MANRILRDGWKDSDRIIGLSWREQVCFLRLLSTVDDFGRYDGRVGVLRTACYPLELDKMSEADLESCLQKLETAGLISFYYVQNKRYVQVQDFRQQVRAKSSKWPEPPSGCAADAQHMPSTRAADAQHMHTKAEAKTKTNNNKKVRGNTTVDTEAPAPPAPPPPADLPDGFGEWLGVMCGCVRAFREARSLHPEVTDEARAAYERFPRAVEYAELLRAYYDDRLREDCRRKEFWRPQGGIFFRNLEDVVFKHAVRWQKEARWKPQGSRKTQPAPKKDGLAVFKEWERMKQEEGLS